MAADYTPNYNLDLYASTDKPNLRDQYNAAMGKIDAQLKKSADDVTNANANVLTMQTQMMQAQKDIAALESTVETHGTQITDVQKTADDAFSLAQTNENDISSVESDVTQLKTQMSTANGNIESQQSTIADLDNQIKTIGNEIAGKAPTDHSSTATTYGLGNGSEYGHVKLSDASGNGNVNGGTAATPLAVQNAMSTVEARNSLKGYSIQTVTSGFLDSRLSVEKGGGVKIITHNGAGCINIIDLQCNNQTSNIDFVPVIDLANYGFQFKGTDYALYNVVMTTDAELMRTLRIVRGSNGHPQLQLSMPNNNNLTFIGQISFIYTTDGARNIHEGGMMLADADDADTKYILG